MTTTYPARCGSVALLMLLAACGNAPGSPDTSHADHQVTKAAPSRSAAAVPGNAGRAATQQQTIDTKVPAISPDSISAELLATLLVINTDEAGGKVTEQATGPFQTGRLHHAPRAPSLRSYQKIQRHDHQAGRFQIVAFPRTSSLAEYSYFDQSWEAAGVGFPIVVNVGEQYQSSMEPFSFRNMGDKPAGTELLSMHPEISLGGVKLQSPGGKRYALRIGDRLPLNSVLHRWTGEKGETVDLMVIRGVQDRELRTCFNTRAGTMRRLLCSVWRIPDNWAFPNGLGRFDELGAYLVDDRRAVPGARNVLYWQSRGAYAHEQQLPRGKDTPATHEPISRLGVSGDVFATMLASEEMLLNTQARPATGPVPHGRLMPSPDKPNIQSEPIYTGLGIPGSHGNYGLGTRLVAGGGNYPYTPLGVSLGLSWLHTKDNGYGFDPGKPAQSGAELVNLTHNVQTEWTPQGGQSSKLVLHPSYAFSVRKDRLVPFSFRLQRWHARDGRFVDLRLLRGVKPDQARLCTHVQLKAIERLQCADWQVPAGWTLGQPLKLLGVSVVDTRSVHPGETGYHYWMTEAMSR
ncbi:MAG: hypothetical protein Q4B17_13425 [Lautropia sp.]|nr:hypothetical protein [Lautropia sp.]